MRILGIETSCDETSAAVVEDGRKTLSNIVLSQENLHRRFGGIVPEIASRAHVENINRVIAKALRGARLDSKQIGALAVTVGPGLVGSLLVGKMTAEALAWVWNKPLVAVNHLEAHLFSNLLAYPELSPPFLGLIVSGGHTDLVLVKDFGRYTVLGRTRDDAAGECFDKAAKILNLGYPGGPRIDRLAKQGNPHAIRFARPYLHGSWDFSFSGLKTAMLYFWRGRGKSGTTMRLADVCASFQCAIVDVLVGKTMKAAEKFGIRKIAVGGGVAANSALREKFMRAAGKVGTKVFLPPHELCTDNAAMIAAAGYYKLQADLRTRRKNYLRPHFSIDPSLPIANWS